MGASLDDDERRRTPPARQGFARNAEPVGSPASGKSHHDDPRILRRLDEELGFRCHELRHGGDPDRALDGDRGVREETARVATALARAHETEWGGNRARKPGTHLERRPVVLGAREGHQARP